MDRNSPYSLQSAVGDHLPSQDEWAAMGQKWYDEQRGFRDRHPVFEAALNFVPYVGAVASADDTANSLNRGEYGQAAMDALGIIPGGKLMKSGMKVFGEAQKMARAAAVAAGQAQHANAAANVVRGAGVAGAGVVGGKYADDIIRKELSNDF